VALITPSASIEATTQFSTAYQKTSWRGQPMMQTPLDCLETLTADGAIKFEDSGASMEA
jgi:hypothetical protein